MRRSIAHFGMVLVCMALAMQAPHAASGRDPYQFFFDENFGNFAEELTKARAQGKKGILLFFEMDECPFCHRMKETILNQPEVQAYFKQHFLSFAVDIKGDLEMTDFEGVVRSQKDFAFTGNRVRATPVFAFFDLDGKPLARYTGATSNVEEFLWLGEYVVSGTYKDMPFSKYKREKRGE